MASVSAYHRPATIDEALTLLERPDAVLLGGGTKVNTSTGLVSAGPVEMIDLQSLGLDGVERLNGDRVLIGSMTTLQELVDDDDVPSVIRETAKREAPNTLRSASTVGGCVATAEWESEFLAALLAHDAVVKFISDDGVHSARLADVFAERGLLRRCIITAVTVETGGIAAVARTGRTKADRAIVAAVARHCPDGVRRLAMSGVASTPVLVADPGLVDPPGDFRGSKEYRQALALTLSRRALQDVG